MLKIVTVGNRCTEMMHDGVDLLKTLKITGVDISISAGIAPKVRIELFEPDIVVETDGEEIA